MKQTASLLIRAYIELLKIDHVDTRIQLERTYCILRDQIGKFTGRDHEEIQTTCEQIALQEKSLLR